MPELRLIAYNWAQVDFNLIFLLIGHTGATGGALSMPQPHAFFVAFDQNERVLACGVEKKGSRLLQQAARDWAEKEGLAVPALPSRFVARDVPPKQALLYVYREGGFPFVVPPQVLIDGKLEAELRKRTYIAVALWPGEHIVTIVQPRVPPDAPVPDASVPLDLAQNREYFLLFRLPFWNGKPAEITVQSEEEAMPALAEMKPAR